MPMLAENMARVPIIKGTYAGAQDILQYLDA